MGGDGISNSSLIDSIRNRFVNFCWLTVAIAGGVRGGGRIGGVMSLKSNVTSILGRDIKQKSPCIRRHVFPSIHQPGSSRSIPRF